MDDNSSNYVVFLRPAVLFVSRPVAFHNGREYKILEAGRVHG